MPAKQLCIFHFNDVYHVTPPNNNAGGGAPQFLTVLNRERAHLPEGMPSTTLFSGDVFSPSLESAVSKGSHLVPVLNLLGIDASVYGNHDFDFGVPQLIQMASKCNFPWLISNVWEESGELLAKGQEFTILERGGIKIGVIGLVEREWLDTIVSLPPNLVFKDFVEIGRTLARRLRGPEFGCHMVVALTHMRMPNDEQLAAQVPEIDLVLGGHDHDVQIARDVDLGAPRNREGVAVVKSGTDFRDLGVITVDFDKDMKVVNVQVRHTQVLPGEKETPEVAVLLTDIQEQLAKKLQKAVAVSETLLDARSSTVRLQESALGSFVADVSRRAYDADVALLCGGTIRSDMTYQGEITIRDIMEIFPFEDPLVVIDISGAQLLAALENGVSKWPKQEGRFPQVSGIAFTFDPSRPEGHRIVESHLTCSKFENQAVDLAQTYRVVTRNYLAEGHDGFSSLLPHTTIVDDEAGLLISTIMRKYFLGMKMLKQMSHVAKHSEQTVAAHPHDGSASVQLAKEVEAQKQEKKKEFVAFDCVHQVRGDSRWRRFKKVATSVGKLPVIAPKVDGRIKRVDSGPVAQQHLEQDEGRSQSPV
ncbi:Metallo-dependent phosphatase-like protein [Catenaria anguillulae PL171]|uniref:Metallo-dependent phosphatase-like protein n=1 Tax=Catenaria anguillulae PL171 TaxID=765915 RepID=A0A1Y2I033_9FUNG|nr:Metallo-dependent phosphatase-like protein [Catenaria anguillulae PL171]